MKQSKGLAVFKRYTMGQLQLPVDLDACIPPNHLVRVVHAAIERMDLSVLLRRYAGGGTSSYHPQMMLKVLVYAYSQRIYSSRQIAKALRENLNFMWLSGNSRPDFRTINRFRSTVMKGIIEPVFASVLELLLEEGYVKLENYFLDGTKVEGNANKYRPVWAKTTRRNKERLREKVKGLLEEIDRVNAAEDEQYGDKDLEELGEDGPIDSEKLEKTIAKLNERLKKRAGDKGLAKAVKQLEREYLPRQKRYEEQEKKLGGRNSYAKTDEDATFMRMKDDAMQNGQLKPGYNVQVGTENQFVVGFSLHQQAGDTGCLVPHLEQLREQVGRLPENIVADAAYGNEENYAYLGQAGVGSYVMYNTFHQEQKTRRKLDHFEASQFTYDEQQDAFTCPAGEQLKYRATVRGVSPNGYVWQRRRYEGNTCARCALKGQCTRGAGNRCLEVSLPLQKMRATARSYLLSEHGQRLRARRGVEVESVFGRIKHNWAFRRFMLRGLEKVKVEWGLLCMAHNISKMAAS